MQNGNVFQTADHAIEYIDKTVGVLATHPARINERLAAAKEEFRHTFTDAMPEELDQFRDEIWELMLKLDEMSEDAAVHVAEKILNFADMYHEVYEESRS